MGEAYLGLHPAQLKLIYFVCLFVCLVMYLKV